MRATGKISTQSETAQGEIRTNPSSYRIEYHPQFVEETVLRAMMGHPEESLFRKERDKIYKMQDDEDREEAFQELHLRWFEHLDLLAPLHDVFTYWPILKLSTHKCLLMKARSRKDVGAELYVAPKDSGVGDRERRSIVIQLTPELLTQSQQLLPFLRHELLHIADMLDPKFGYEPNFPRSQMGPTYDQFLQERYRILWDITIDGRLHQEGWLPSSLREKHWTIFRNTFPGPMRDLEIVFSFFFQNGSHTHTELVSFCKSPENWFVSPKSESTSRGQCSVCHFSSFHLINASTWLSPAIISQIQKECTNWHPAQPICRQCADLYELRTSGQ